MADMLLKVGFDVGNLKDKIKGVLNEKFKIDFKGSGAGGGAGGEGKKQSGLLGGILKKLGLLAILASLKPVQQMLEILTAFVTIGLIKIWELLKWLGENIWKGLETVWELLKVGWEWLKVGWDIIEKTFTAVGDKLAEWFNTAVQWIKDLPGNIWGLIKSGFEWLKGLLETVGSFLKGLWDSTVSFLGKVWSAISEGFVAAVKWLSELPGKIWNFLKTGFITVVGWLSGLPQKIWNFLKTGFSDFVKKATDIWNSIKDLPGLIWDKLKGLGQIIADAIKNIGGGWWDNAKEQGSNIVSGIKDVIGVNDAIIRPDGTVIKTHPQDTLIATRTPESVGGGTKTLNFYGVTPQEMIRTIKEELGYSTIGYSRY